MQGIGCNLATKDECCPNPIAQFVGMLVLGDLSLSRSVWYWSYGGISKGFGFKISGFIFS